MNGFYWLVSGVLAGSSRPGGRPGSRGEIGQLDADLSWLRSQGITSMLTLTEGALDRAALEHSGFVSHHIPVVDMTAPTPDQIGEALAFIDRQSAANRAVVVHCLAGQGRTGTILAAYLIRGGLSPERAITELRLVCPHAVENELQERALSAYATRRDWIV